MSKDKAIPLNSAESNIINTNGLKQVKNSNEYQTDAHKDDPDPNLLSCRYYWKNLFGVSTGVFFVLVGYSILFYIQSSLHSTAGLGSLAQAVEYASQVLTCLCLPPFLMRTIGCKWSLVASSVSIAIYIAANLKDNFEALIPASIFLGLGSASMWATMNTVVSDLATGYARLTGSSETATLSRFFSIFFSLVNTAAIWANLLSSYLLSPPDTSGQSNETRHHSLCGANFCDEFESSFENSSIINLNNYKVPQSEVTNLVAVGLGSVALGIILILTLLSSYDSKSQKTTESIRVQFLATIKLLRNPNLLLLIFYTMNLGLMTAFISADFNKAFVTCSLGIHSVGFVTTCYGITMSLGTVLIGFVAPYIPRVALFLVTVLLNIGDLLLMLFWVPYPEAPAMLYVMSGIWGGTFAVWLSQLCALYGDVFTGHHQEAFSNHRIFDCVGFAIGFAWSHYLCMKTKIYLILAVTGIGTVAYLIVERRLKISRRQDNKDDEVEAAVQK